MHRPYWRRTRLIQPKRQLKIVGIFLGLSALSLLTQFFLISEALTGAAESLPEGGSVLMSMVPGLLLRSLLVSLAIAMPITFGVGVIVTFRLVGPAHKFETYLRALARGDEPGLCRIRAEDEFQEIPELINEALRKVAASPDAGETADEPPLRAAG